MRDPWDSQLDSLVLRDVTGGVHAERPRRRSARASSLVHIAVHSQSPCGLSRGVSSDTAISVMKLNGIEIIPGFENGMGDCVGSMP